MDIEEARFGDAVVLRPKERIDQTSADDFQSHLLNAIESGATAVLVDFSDVDYISSVGLRALMIAAKKGKAGDVALGVSDLQPNVNEIFEISRFNFVVTVHATLRDGVAAASDEALAAFEAG
jgi:anti-sigma B factor antagonist